MVSFFKCKRKLCIIYPSRIHYIYTGLGSVLWEYIVQWHLTSSDMTSSEHSICYLVMCRYGSDKQYIAFCHFSKYLLSNSPFGNISTLFIPYSNKLSRLVQWHLLYYNSDITQTLRQHAYIMYKLAHESRSQSLNGRLIFT